MFSGHITIKLAAILFSLFLVVLIPLAFVIHEVISGFFFEHEVEEMKQSVSHYESMYEENGTIATGVLETLTKEHQDVYVLNESFQPNRHVGQNTDDFISGIPDGEREEIQSGGMVEREYTDEATGEKYFVVGSLLQDGGEESESIYLFSSQSAIEAEIQEVQRLITLAVVGAFLLAFACIIILVRRITLPLLQMEQATRQIAKGELEVRVHHPSKDEVGSLGTAINDLAEDLKQYRDARRAFLADISHELRTPVTYIKGYSHILKEKLYDQKEEEDAYLTILSDEAERLNRLVEELFDLAQMDDGHMKLTKKHLALAPMLERIVKGFALPARQQGLELDIDVEEGLIVYGDELRLEQVFMNLMTNALRYTEKGSISIRGGRNSAHQPVITVTDTGIGIPQKELPFIFDRFYRVDKSRSREGGGTGLGLAIVKQLMHAHDGDIQVSSVPGEGTSFILTFARPEKNAQ
ncbi:Signal transduction histidine kinase [Marinococcus luteus]|uniref:histidine kinase n=1 Tax=Marinococcus luteus TaxID=1122204 RepID=A0A1H2QWJ1_9BACI|nr:HAMP domain-containing sensor histidine kinase [Marinococcus luteus]SDW11004.1 Signal transduction histidine kinase [Marinococcus luteus]